MRYRLRTSVRVLRDLATITAGAPVVVLAGISRSSDTEEWLLTSHPDRNGHQLPHEGRVHVVPHDTDSSWDGAVAALPALGDQTRRMALAVGRGPAAGSLAAVVLAARGFAVVEDITLVGAGLQRERLVAESPTIETIEEIRANQPRAAAAYARWSRSSGALGEEVMRHLRDQQVGVVGVGRTGAAVTGSLARTGVRRLVVVDPDVVETHNLGEMDSLKNGDVGRPKVTVLVEALAADVDAQITALTMSVDSMPAATTLRTMDVLIGCADEPLARLLTSILGAAYLRPVVDIGTGIFGDGDARRMGADVRLILPGSCLVCAGGVPGLTQDGGGRRHATQRTSERPAWREQRAGSLRTLNQVAVGLGLRLFEDLIGGRLASSVWLRLDYGADGLPRLEHVPITPDPACPVCRLAASGDAVLHVVPDLLNQARDFRSRVR